MTSSIAVLSSGGLDSSVLLFDAARRMKVFPLYIRQGLVWENEELKALHAFTQALHNPNIQPITILSFPIQSLYGDHWSLTGCGIPSQDDPDFKTYLPGRNVLLLSLAAVWGSLHHVPRMAIGSLSQNSFPDASPDFFRQISKTLSNGLAFHIRIEAPFREKFTKEDLIRKYHHLPLELTLTCMNPRQGTHCGRCNKCYERQAAYKAAGVPDVTKYSDEN